MSSFVISLIVSLFFLNFNLSFSQTDTSKVKIGPDDLERPGVGRYFNFADKNKVNIEVTLLGASAGKYLIPQGTTVFDFLIMAGTTNEQQLEEIKIVRFRSESPTLKGSQVIVLSFDALYGDQREVLKSQPNPALKPGDMIILPEIKPQEGFWYYLREGLSYVGTLISFYYLIYNLFIRNN